jgi:thioredoxin reductase
VRRSIESIAHLCQTCPHIIQIAGEKSVEKYEFPHFTISTNKNTYETRTIVVGIGASNTLLLTDYCHLCNHTQNHFLKNNAYN